MHNVCAPQYEITRIFFSTYTNRNEIKIQKYTTFRVNLMENCYFNFNFHRDAFSNHHNIYLPRYENATKKEPGNEEFLSHLFMAYVRLGQFKKQQATAINLYKVCTSRYFRISY